jgi:hypothetical protein
MPVVLQARWIEGDAQRYTLEKCFEELESVLIVRLALNEVLEDSQHWCNLSCRNDLVRTSRQKRTQESNEGRNVPSRFPQGRSQERREEDFVRVGHVGRRVGLEELGENLEYEGSEFGDVLLEDDVERREEGVLEGGQGRRVSGRDESRDEKLSK